MTSETNQAARKRRSSPDEARRITSYAIANLTCHGCGAEPGSPCVHPGPGRTVCKNRWGGACVELTRQAKAARRTPEQAAILASLPRLTQEQIEAGRSPRGGFGRRELARWGVPWPPPAGWMQALLHGFDASGKA